MKDTFILKTKYGSVVNKLSDKQAGVLFKMLFEYVENGANAGSTDEKVEMAFEFIKLDLDAFSESYQKKLAVNKENGKKGGNPNFVKGKSNPYYEKKDNPNITEDNPTLPNITEDNPNDNDNDYNINKQTNTHTHEEKPKAENSTLKAYDDFNGDAIALAGWLSKRWNDAKRHYNVGAIGNVAILGNARMNLIEVAKNYTQGEIELAIKGVFIQKQIYPQFTLSPDKMLEPDHFSTFYNAGLTNTQLYNKESQKERKSSKNGVTRNIGDL
ncbi:DUF6291 domain-containing protein [Capnocytophaga sputigena]|jgi:hypothetical protein|uniref:DUF6291 domain-containing protein n=1 Tax=Capnocytophaga sputigena TaxID=1019 RepID=UPI0020644E44|nr:DUF6291 domain-containing protein [Capnocytophaga sputigena]DAJ29845.1 MAG TPA: hypothetical protein [Caudoviricetes sp.]